jgi:hypothetical protein
MPLVSFQAAFILDELIDSPHPSGCGLFIVDLQTSVFMPENPYSVIRPLM